MNGLRVKDVNDLHINFQTQQTQVFNILGFFRHRQEIESIVAAKYRSWLVKIYSPNVGLEPTTLRLRSHALSTELAGQMLHIRNNSDIISVTTIDNSIRFGFALCRSDLVHFYMNING